MNISLFREFIVSVPICCEIETCTEIWQRFQQMDTAVLLVVDADRRPLGLLRLERLVPLFSRRSSSARHRAVLASSLQAWLVDHPEGLEPIQILPEPSFRAAALAEADFSSDSTDLSENVGLQGSADFATWLTDLTAELLKPAGLEASLIVVDSYGRALGQLDKLRLLQHQLQCQSSELGQVTGQEAGGAVDRKANREAESWPQQPSRLASSPTRNPAGRPTDHSAGRPEASPSRPAAPHAEPVPHPLLDLLERLPLPLMLQTETGHVISQNLAWRQQVGAIQHPQQIRRAAAQILETALSCRTDAKPDAMHLNQSADFQVDQRAPWPVSPSRPSESLLLSGTSSDSQASICQFGTEPNTCVCFCPMQDGQERVWQFIKIPMGTAALETQTPDQNSDASLLGQPFKLASLKFNPVPHWQSLMQTAQLWLIWAQDVTEQQQVAKELAARNADLVQLNRLKDEFLACISHELKTPLTAVLGMSSLLKDHMIGDLNERQSHYAQLIYRGGRHLIAIVNNILDLTRTETGQLELLLEQVHIPRLCQQAYEQSCHILTTEAVSPETAHPVLNFQLEIQPELRYIVADEMRLKQMLMNLLSNAIKFTEPGQPMGLRVESWEGWIAFTVWDSGLGIPAEKQHLIFQKFQQLEDPLTRQFQGTGLGLVLTQQLARLHGGEVTFTSVAGQGSQFTLLLPPVPPQASAANFDLGSPLPAVPSLDRGSDRSPDHNRLILLVEADAHQLQDRVEQLNELGYRPVVARSGTEAIEKARRLQPAAILLNPALPQLSGWDVLTLLKADSSTQAIPLVVTAVRVQKDQAYQNGADGFLNLPLETNALKRCFDRLIQVTLPNPPSSADLTVLHLSEGSASLTLVPQHQAFSAELNHLLHPYHCRVLEVDDLDQADLLARVWKPDVVLIDQVQTEPHLFMQQLRNSALAKLPLIILSPELTRIASQSGLAVFHYQLPESVELAPEAAPNLTELVQMMQLAAGSNWVPHVLIADCAGLAQASDSAIRPPVRALVQYLQTAGFRSAVNHDWAKIRQKLNQQSVDLLLLCLSSAESPAAITAVVRTLESLPHRPPILVWCYQSPLAQMPAGPSAPVDSELFSEAAPWQSVAARVLPASVSILELLAAINQTLSESRQPQIKPAGKPTGKPRRG